MSLPKFNQPDLLITALTHRSALNEHISSAKESNERLEYLGDAVLELITTDFLYHQLPDAQEGKLTAIRSALVKTTTLAEVGRKLGLGEKLFLSHGEESCGGRTNEALLADTVEAVIGALYLDQGLLVAKEFVSQNILQIKFETILKRKLYRDAKSMLQEQVQALGYLAPSYQVVKEDGPDHEKSFTVEVLVDNRVFGSGTGKSKQIAQQQAASAALEKLPAKDHEAPTKKV